ncbi:MAG: sigma-70 family RNA polymerase sigma factor [Spirochaetes bacterium]|jgi:RNA polymerase sigma-70 factor (ECF subfamily)|nr:sigma-70 family RNA polymerase sigma factor [Spirochaetota bacterium]
MKEELKKSTERDEKLIGDFLGNDHLAFEKLVIRYKDMIFNLCFRITCDYDEANDCAQETFIKVYRSLGGFQFRSSFKTWLYRIAINTCRSRISSKKRKINGKTVSMESIINPEARFSGPGRNADSDPAFNYEKKEFEVEIQEALASLPEDERMLVVLRDIDNRSYDEIITVTGINEGTVKSRLSRARHRLRSSLRDKFKDEMQ